METANLPIKGLNTDVLEKFQEEGTYRFALNAVLETEDGDLRGISNEHGTTLCNTSFPAGKKVIGHVLTDTSDIVLFLFDPATVRPAHEIGILNSESCVYTTIARGECLNFKRENQINAIFRIKDGCTRYVYFTDNLNPYRVVNITDTTDWVNQTTKNILSCDKIKFTRDAPPPQITGYNLNGYDSGVADFGGVLEYGTYSFSFRYLDYDGNPTDWIQPTRYFPVMTGRRSDLENDRTAAFHTGAVNVSTENGYRPASGKSIALNINRLSTQFSHYEIAVIKRGASSGEITAVNILPKKPILNPSNLSLVSDVFIYTGGESVVLSSLEEIFSETVKLDRVVAHTQADNRLLVAGVTNPARDYTGFQRHASSIETRWLHQAQDIFMANSKSATGYQLFSGLMHDEVYAFGIVYVFKDGSTSPVFHIPGRKIDITTPLLAGNVHITDNNPLDSFTLPNTDPNIFDINVDKRWQVYNTYTKLNSTATEGYMGYYESSDTNYPTKVIPCDTNPDGYWGRDFSGDLLTGKIRHHRTPTYSPKTSLGGNFVGEHDICGVKFIMDEEYPHSDIIGHYYVNGDRSSGDKTVLDVGVLSRSLLSPDEGSPTLFPNSTFSDLASIINDSRFNGGTTTETKDHFFLSNKTQYLEKMEEGSYLRVLDFIISKNLTTVANASAQFYPPNKTVDLNVVRDFEQDWFARPLANFNYDIEGSAYLGRSVNYLNRTSVGGVGFFEGNSVTTINEENMVNRSSSINLGVVSLDRGVVGPNTTTNCLARVAIKSHRNVFNTLDKIIYKALGTTYAIKAPGVTLNTSIYSGDIINSQPYFSESFIVENNANTFFSDYSFLTVILESDINTTSRLNDRENNTFKHFTGGYTIFDATADSLLSYLKSKLQTSGDVITYDYERHYYSKAYDFFQSDKPYFPLDEDFNVCNECYDEEYPYRIYYSQQDTLESGRDYYRTILPNNYKDLDGYIGKITDLFTFKSKLFALTTNSCVMLPFRPQVVQTNEGTAYIGAGEFLSLPLVPLKTTDYAFGGTSHFKSRVITEYGAVFVDDISGRPFVVDENLTDLSLSGMRNFFQQEGTLSLVSQMKSKGINYNIYSTSSPVGVGYITTYEPRFKRLIITKKDFSILPSFLSAFSFTTTPINNTLSWDGARFVYKDNNGVLSYPELSNPFFFENKSFTLSFSFLTNSFVSFHSYLPEYLFNNYRNFFSNSLYKHTGDYQYYYDRKYDFVVDYIANLNTKEIKTFSHVTLRNRTYYNGFTNNTFDRILAYNTHQSSGVIFLDKDKNFDLSHNNLYSPVKSVGDTYRINGLRDNTISNSLPIWDYSWTTKSQQYYIDKLPNILNINTNPNLFEQQRLKDYYLGLRLFYKPVYNEKITVDILDTTYSNRNR
jgi:hypothetical protein